MNKTLVSKKIFWREISDYNGPLSPSEVRATHDVRYYDGHAECNDCLSKTHGRSIDHPCFGWDYRRDNNYPPRQDRLILTYSDGSQEIEFSPAGGTFTQEYVDSFEVEEIIPTCRESVMGRGPNRECFVNSELEFAVVELAMER